MDFTQSPQFYSLMFRNLNALRDIQKLIVIARSRQRRSVVFRDELGNVMELVVRKKVAQKPHKHKSVDERVGSHFEYQVTAPKLGNVMSK